MLRSIIIFILSTLLLGSAALSLAGCGRGDEALMILEAETTERLSEGAMEEARTAIEKRLETADLSGAKVARQDRNRMLVTLAHRRDIDKVKELIGRRGRLELRMVDFTADPEQAQAGRAPPGSEILPFASGSPGERIAVRNRRIITAAMIVDARTLTDDAGQPAVAVRFNPVGTDQLARATRHNVGKAFAIVVDGEVLAAPVINEPLLGGMATISGGFTAEQANQLAVAFRSGPLPVGFKVIEERILAP
jgi:preprotein translocase subunit SecD